LLTWEAKLTGNANSCHWKETVGKGTGTGTGKESLCQPTVSL
jgi:hypothetical protein